MTTLEEAEQLHRTGQLQEAKALYLSILQLEPTNINALHLLAILCAEEGDVQSAEKYLQEGLRIAPQNEILSLHLANIYRAKGAFDSAEKILLKLTKTHPKFAAAYNNLGTIYFAQAKWQAAIKAYQTALDLQENYVDAYYNLGLAMQKLARFDEALNAYEAVLHISAKHPGALFQQARLLMQKSQYDKAITALKTILEDHPYHLESQINLATIYLTQHNHALAKEHYLKALAIDEHDQQVLFNLGVLSAQAGQIDAAIDFYERIINENPQHFEAHNNLGFIYLLLQKNAESLAHYQKALAIQPDNEVIAHTIRILTGDKNIATSPIKYVESLFDSYADHFDAHLKGALQYQVPEQMVAVVKEFLPNKNALKILDLGCGTGLSGEQLKPFAQTLIGVDVSQKMLDEARKKAIYTELYQADILSYLQSSDAKFDLVTACDVLVYFGELTEIFHAVHQVLEPNGYFIFNTEINEDAQNYQMTASGRFAHQKKYLDELIATNHFKIKTYKVILMRVQNLKSVYGHLYLLQK